VRYGGEFAVLLEDLGGDRSHVLDIVRSAVDARLRSSAPLGLVFGLPAGLALAVDIVYTNVIRPGADGTVFAYYAAIFALQFVAGLVAARRTRPPFGPALTAATAGAVIAIVVIVTFVVVDNLFLGTVGSQPEKIRGLAGSPFASMRLYVNVTLVLAAAVLIPFLSASGLVLGEAGRRLAR
jgi:hypothetical protein